MIIFLHLLHLKKFKCARNPLDNENAERSPSFSRERELILFDIFVKLIWSFSAKDFAEVFIKLNIFQERVARRLDNLLHFFYPND